MIQSLLKAFVGSKNEREVKKLYSVVDQINEYNDQYQQFSTFADSINQVIYIE